MVFLTDWRRYEPLDWLRYEPDSCDPDEYIRAALADDLTNLSRSWSPYVPDLEDTFGIIEALQTIRHGLDDPDSAPLSLLPLELEHFPPHRDD